MRALITSVIAVTIGIAAWQLVLVVHPTREAWDVSEYWVVAYPAMILFSAVLGYAMPIAPWRWGVAVGMGQGVWVLLTTALKSGMPNLWPLSLLFFAALSIPCIIGAYAGAWLRRR